MAIVITSGQVVGLEGTKVDVEVDLSQGLHRFSLVGLPDKAVEESKERIASAIKNSGLKPPHKKNQRVTINLAPADLKKEGPLFDLPIALGYALASKQITFSPEGKMFVGELALDGSLRRARGMLPLALTARKMGAKELFVPKGNGKEAAFVGGISVYEAPSLGKVMDHLEERSIITPLPKTAFRPRTIRPPYGFEDIKGQETAKRAAEIAAAGMHHLGLSGPPGTGKTLIARALASILPPLSFKEAVEVTEIHSIAGSRQEERSSSGLITTRPFRSPHHTASYASLIGGGAIPKPGEITMAHRGVLFLDELPEFEGRVIEALREPLEESVVSISRVKDSFIFPANILLVAAMNLCPCGRTGTNKTCTCTPQQLARYTRRLSGPIVDRIDLWASVPQVEYEKLEGDGMEESSAEIQKRTVRASDIQKARFQGTPMRANSDIGVRDIKTFCPLSRECTVLLQNAARNLQLSARSYHRVIKVSRTIADLAEEKEIKEAHLLEALQFRPRMEEIV